MVTLSQGGLSSGYKKSVADKTDETYAVDGVALIRISGISTHNNKAIQVEAVCATLNSIAGVDTGAEVFRASNTGF